MSSTILGKPYRDVHLVIKMIHLPYPMSTFSPIIVALGTWQAKNKGTNYQLKDYHIATMDKPVLENLTLKFSSLLTH